MYYTDQMMREVRLEKPPSRIISLVPSLTELLFDLGLKHEIAGITKFCIHPDEIFRTKTRIGGTKKVNHEKIKSINPDLIIANKEENLKIDIEALENKYPVWVSDVYDLDSAVEMIHMIGELTQKSDAASDIIEKITSNFKSINKFPAELRTLYLIWKDPYMAAGTDTFINDMLMQCGFSNVLAMGSRYPELTVDDIRNLHPELILLSSEPYPFSHIHIKEFQEILTESLCLTVDGESFSWYGSHLIKSPDYFNSLIKKVQTSIRINN